MDIVALRRKKFMRNIGIGLIALGIVSLLLNVSPGYKRDKFTDVTNLVLNEENITEELLQEIYISDSGIVYLSYEDVERLFDSTIYYDKKYDQVITTSDTSVAFIPVKGTKVLINNEEKDIIDTLITNQGVLYIPISEIQEVYDISVRYAYETNIVIIDNLNKGMITAELKENVILKFRPRALSKDVCEVQEGERVSCFYTTSAGWRQVRTDDGITGYLKANMLKNEMIIRQDIPKRGEAKIISVNSKGETKITKEDKTINVKIAELFKIISQDNIGIDKNASDNTDTNKYELWTTISNKGVERQIEIFLADSKIRNDLINKIAELSLEYGLNGVNVDFRNIEGIKNFERFLIELAPRLRNNGINICVTMGEGIVKENIKDIVDYVIEY